MPPLLPPPVNSAADAQTPTTQSGREQYITFRSAKVVELAHSNIRWGDKARKFLLATELVTRSRPTAQSENGYYCIGLNSCGFSYPYS